MSEFIICDAETAQPGTRPYYIGYFEMVNGYRHAWTEVDRFGRRRLRHGRTPNHPADPRCPECLDSGANS